MRLIDTDAIKLSKGFFESVDNVPKFYEWLNTLPTIDPVKHGEWVADRWEYQPVCSVCRHPAEIIEVDGHLVGCNDPSGETGGYFEVDTDDFLSPYCPYCGAQMENPAEYILDEDGYEDATN